MTSCIVPERAYTDGYVLKSGRIRKEGTFSDCCISIACGIAGECAVSECVVERACGIALERLSAKRIVVVAGRIAEQSERSVGCIGAASGVAQKGCGTGRRIFVGRIEEQCSSPDGRIQLARSDIPKRKEHNRRFNITCTQANKVILSFCC